MDRLDLERRVDELAEEYKGEAFADEIKALAGDLNSDEEEMLKEILLERGAKLDQALMERVDARGWFQRQWDKGVPEFERRSSGGDGGGGGEKS